MLNVKLIKVTDFYSGSDFYLNLNYISSISPIIPDCTFISMIDEETFKIKMPFEDFIDYLVELSGLQNGGEER